MSWSASRSGKPVEVAAQLKADLEGIRCIEPEETIKNKVGEIIATALAAYPPEFSVKVSAVGSQSNYEGGPVNDLRLEIKPIHDSAK